MGKTKKKRKTETERGGQEMYSNIPIQEKVLPIRPLARVVVDVDVHIFNIKNRVERGVELKFSPLGASRGRGGREDSKKPQRGTRSRVVV